MTKHDLVSGLFTSIQNNELVHNRDCIYPASKTISNILRVLQGHSYIGAFEYIEDGRGGKFKIQLMGRINKCVPIKPRYSVKASEFEKWAKLFLPAKDIGILVVSTPKGVISHIDAINQKSGGRLIGYVY